MNYEKTKEVFLTALSIFDLCVRNAPKRKLSKEYWAETQEIKENVGLNKAQKWAQKAFEAITNDYLLKILGEAKFTYIDAETGETIHSVGNEYEKVSPLELNNGYETGKYKGCFVWVETGMRATEPTGRSAHEK